MVLFPRSYKKFIEIPCLLLIKVNNKVTDWFTTYAGLRQGQNDSPTAFATFINSFAVKIKSLNVGISVELQIRINELYCMVQNMAYESKL